MNILKINGLSKNPFKQSVTWNILRKWKLYTAQQKVKRNHYNTAFELHRKLERENWCKSADQWATGVLRARNQKAKNEHGQRYYQICRYVVNKWRLFVKREKNKKIDFVDKVHVHAMGDAPPLLPPVTTFEPTKFRAPRIPAFLATQPRTRNFGLTV